MSMAGIVGTLEQVLAGEERPVEDPRREHLRRHATIFAARSPEPGRFGATVHG